MKDFIKKYWLLPLFIIAMSVLLSFGASISMTPQYKSSVRLLVIQRQTASLDAFSASRSAETVATLLSRIVYSTSFYDRLGDAGYELKNDFSSDPAKRKKEWEKAIVANASTNGSLEIDVYHPDREGAEAYALAIAHVLVNNGKDYHGGGSSVEIKMVDRPFTTSKPATPHIFQNTILGFFGGMVISISLLLMLYFYNEKNKTASQPAEFYRDEVLDDERSGFTSDDIAESGEVEEATHYQQFIEDEMTGQGEIDRQSDLAAEEFNQNER